MIAYSSKFASDVKENIEETGIEVKGLIEFKDKDRCSDEIIWWEDVEKGITLVHGSNNTDRLEIVSKMAEFEFETFIHPSARVPKSTKIGKGVYIGPHVVLGGGCIIGNHVIINRTAHIGHHVILSDYVTVNPGANIGGMSVIGNGSYIAMGSIVLNNLEIGSGVVVGAGAVVTKEFGNDVQLLGVPAKISKYAWLPRSE